MADHTVTLNGYGINGQFSDHAITSVTADDTSAQTDDKSAPPSRDQIGWSFVQTYYLRLSENPDELYYFYAKKSASVWGNEGEQTPISTGRTSIKDRLKSFDFKNVKVRVTNVDLQSIVNDCILVQVIGEMSNNGAPLRKFIHTFILAPQQQSFYVVNDVFRYIQEEDEEEEHDNEIQELEALADTGADSMEIDEPVAEKLAQDSFVAKVDQATQKLAVESVSTPEVEKPEEAPAVQAQNGLSTADAVELSGKDKEEVSEKVGGLKEPTHTKAAPTPRTKSPQPLPPPKPVLPKTWANLVAANVAAAAAAAPQVAEAAPPPAAAPRAPVVRQAAQPTESAHKSSPSASNQAKASEWTTAGDGKKTRHQYQPGRNGEGVSAYIKYVTETVSEEQVREALEKYGTLSYFDISRAKNCAFVDFDTVEGYLSAVAANPLQVGDEQIVVEERRPRAPYAPGARGRGNGPTRGNERGGHPGRGGYPRREDSGRGSFGAGRGRGNTVRGGA